MKSFQTVQTADPILTKLQQNISDAISQSIAYPPVAGLVLSGIALVSGVNKIQHKLGRQILGYQVGSISAATQLFDTIASASDGAQFLYLNSSAPATVSLWVY